MRRKKLTSREKLILVGVIFGSVGCVIYLTLREAGWALRNESNFSQIERMAYGADESQIIGIMGTPNIVETSGAFTSLLPSELPPLDAGEKYILWKTNTCWGGEGEYKGVRLTTEGKTDGLIKFDHCPGPP